MSPWGVADIQVTVREHNPIHTSFDRAQALGIPGGCTSLPDWSMSGEIDGRRLRLRPPRPGEPSLTDGVRVGCWASSLCCLRASSITVSSIGFNERRRFRKVLALLMTSVSESTIPGVVGDGRVGLSGDMDGEPNAELIDSAFSGTFLFFRGDVRSGICWVCRGLG